MRMTHCSGETSPGEDGAEDKGVTMGMTHCSGETSPGEDGAKDKGVTNEDDSLFWRNLSRRGRSQGRGCY